MSQLYIRVRGRVLGPYEHDKLQALVQRGQFSRMHEVSEDGVNWVRASTYPELFTGGSSFAASTQATSQPSAGNGNYAASAAATAAADYSMPQEPKAAQQQQGRSWYYTLNGQEYGPADFSVLQSLAASGQLTASDVVWSEGMEEWMSVQRLPGLSVPSAPTAVAVSAGYEQHRNAVSVNTGSTGSTDTGRVSDGACHALEGTKPWVVLIAVLTFIGAAFNLVYGFVVGNLAIMLGIAILVLAICQSWAGYLMINYVSRINQLLRTRTTACLESALQAQRSFWMFVGIVWLVLMSIFVVLLIWFLVAVFVVGTAFSGIPWENGMR